MARTRLERMVFVTDTHGDMIDRSAENAFLDFCKTWKPDVRIHGGDFMDLRALRQGASDEEKNEGVKADISAGVDFVRRAGIQVLLWGNHDYRIVRGVRVGCGRLREYATLLLNSAILDRLPSVQHVQYGKRCTHAWHDATMIHGYHAGVYAGRQAAAAYGPGKVVMGHVHSDSQFIMPTLRPSEGHTVACLCNLNMDYAIAHANTLRQSHGWLYGVADRNGNTTLWHATKLGDHWILPSEFTTYRGDK